MAGFQDFESFRQEQKGARSGRIPRAGRGAGGTGGNAAQAATQTPPPFATSVLTPAAVVSHRTVYYLDCRAGVLILLALCFLPLPFGTVTLTGLQTLEEQDIYRAHQSTRQYIAAEHVGYGTPSAGRFAYRRCQRAPGVSATVRIQIEERKAVAVGETEFGLAVFDRTGWSSRRRR